MHSKFTINLQEFWVIFFFLGMVMLNFPFMHIFNKNELFFGIPLIILYLFIGWPLSIMVVWLFSLHLGRQPGDTDNSQDQA